MARADGAGASPEGEECSVESRVRSVEPRPAEGCSVESRAAGDVDEPGYPWVAAMPEYPWVSVMPVDGLVCSDTVREPVRGRGGGATR